MLTSFFKRILVSKGVPATSAFADVISFTYLETAPSQLIYIYIYIYKILERATLAFEIICLLLKNPEQNGNFILF